MATSPYDVERMTGHRTTGVISAIRWGAIFAGMFTGIGFYLLLTLFGVAAGLAAVDPQAQQVGGVSIWAGIWTFISMLVAAFVGGWVAGRSSGLRRRVDGMLHGFVAWGFTTLLLMFLATGAAAGVLGGLGQAIQGAPGQALGAATAASWGLFFSLLISLVLGVWGGAIGARGTSNRALGDHSDERYHHIEA